MNTKVRQPITLSTDRIVIHTMESNGSQLATPTPGNPEMTNAEWEEYVKLLRSI